MELPNYRNFYSSNCEPLKGTTLNTVNSHENELTNTYQDNDMSMCGNNNMF